VTRWNRRLLLGAIVLLVPALAGCEAGLDAPTLQFHPASAGATTVQNGIRIDNAFVLGAAPGSTLPPGGQAGVFLSIQAQNGDQLVKVTAPDHASSASLTSGTVDLPAQSLVNLGGPVPEVVLNGLSSPISGGDTITMKFIFAQAGTITLAVPVEPNAYAYATYSPPPPTPTVTPTTSATGKKAHGTATGSASASPTATP
jgi:copper(I)-binding protein